MKPLGKETRHKEEFRDIFSLIQNFGRVRYTVFFGADLILAEKSREGVLIV